MEIGESTSEPSQAQTGLLKAIEGFSSGFGRGLEDTDKTNRAAALQAAIERRQEQKDERAGLPKSIYGHFYEKMTGQPLPADAPDRISPQLGVALFGSDARNYGADRRLEGTKYGVDNKKFAPRGSGGSGDHKDDQNQAKLAQMGQAAAIKALGAKYKNGATPPLNKLTPEDAELVNNAFAVGAGPGYKGGPYVKSTVAAAPPSTMNKLTMGLFGTPEVKPASQVLPPQSGGPTVLPPDVQDGIRKARALGWDDNRILQNLATKGHTYSQADIAGVQ